MNFFSFNKMITPRIIPILYFLLVLSIIYLGFQITFTFGFSLPNLGSGLFYIIFGVLGARIFCELVLIIFKIYDYLQQIAEKQDPTL